MMQKERTDNWKIRLVSQQQVDSQLQQIERRIDQIGRMRDVRRISKKVIRTLERIIVLRQLDLITEAEAIQFAGRAKQAGKESTEKAAAG